MRDLFLLGFVGGLLLSPCQGALKEHEEQSERKELSVSTQQIQAELDAQAMYSLAKTMLEDKTITDVSSVTQLLEKAAKSGYYPADTLLLYVYEGKFKGLPRDEKKALEHALRIADSVKNNNEQTSIIQRKEQAASQYHLAFFFEHGWGGESSLDRAFEAMESSFLLGDPRARVGLARYYMLGMGCKKDSIKALSLLREQMDIDPTIPLLYFYLGYMCEQGMGLAKPRYNWAIQYYSRGAELGDDHAINNLASMYERGVGVAADKAQALTLYRHAATMGNKEASRNLQRLGFLIDQEHDQEHESKQQKEPWRLLVNRMLLKLSKKIPFETGLPELMQQLNLEMEHKWGQSQ